MDFSKKDNYTVEDIKSLISNEVEENIHLDYKAAGALEKNDKKRTEITKDVSAFANSDGGIIIYGVAEEDHKPQELSTIDGRIFTKEWLENVIQLIQPRIEDIRIFPIRGDDVGQTLYVVKIPRSGDAPHMANDKRYYKRYNFMAVPMEDYEVKDLYNRVSVPILEITACSFSPRRNGNNIDYELVAAIVNNGNQYCGSYKLNFYINTNVYEKISYDYGKDSYTILGKNRIKLSYPSREPIYPGEQLDLGHFRISVKKENNTIFMQQIVIEMSLFYAGGRVDLAYVPLTKEFVYGHEKISRLLDEKNMNRM